MSKNIKGGKGGIDACACFAENAGQLQVPDLFGSVPQSAG